jgi:hypothetical protein
LAEFPGFVGGTYESISTNFDCERAINCFVERIESGAGKSGKGLITSPGLRSHISTLQAPIRAQFVDPHSYPGEDRMFAVAGNTFVEVFSDGSSIQRGTVSDDGNHYPAYIASNRPGGTQLAIADGYQNLYIYDLAANTFTGPITDTTGLPVYAISVVQIDGYFLVNNGGWNVQYSALNNGLSWNPLNSFSPASGANVLLADHRELWCFGESLIQVYVDTGDADNPWQPAPGGFIQQGCNSPATPSKVDNSIFWIGKDAERGANVVWRANGYTPQRVSNHAVEKALESYPANTNVLTYGFGMVLDGHAFYHLGFQVGNNGWRYDAATGLWHEVARWNTQTGSYENHLARTHCYAWGKHFIGSRELTAGTIYEIGFGFIDDAGNPLRWLRRSPHVAEDGERLCHHRFKLDVQTGAAYTPDGVDPQLQMRFSDDGGQNRWSNERTISVGQRGNTIQRVSFRRLGQPRQTDDRVYEVSSTFPMRIVNAYLDAD